MYLNNDISDNIIKLIFKEFIIIIKFNTNNDSGVLIKERCIYG